MSRRRSRTKAATSRPVLSPAPKRRFWLLGAAVAVAALGTAAVLNWRLTRWQALERSAEAAADSGDWTAALQRWQSYNASGRETGRTLLNDARADLALDRAAQALGALERACALEPSLPEPWLLRLEILRVEDRAIDALRVGWEAYESVPEPDRTAILRGLTLALLAGTPEDLARETLGRWLKGDPDDIEARAALYRRMAESPLGSDPPRPDRIAALTARLDRDGGQLAAREALVLELAESGDLKRGKAYLESWPTDRRDARYYRLLGRWRLDFERRPDRAVEPLRKAVDELPSDWKIHARLARALAGAHQDDAAETEAGLVNRLRETLEQARLGRRLAADLARLDDEKARLDLADLCDRVGLTRLAAAWSRQAQAARQKPVPVP